MKDLIEQRRELTDALAACERGCFPGSPEARQETAAMFALDKFDREHPDIIAEIRRRKSEETAANIWM